MNAALNMLETFATEESERLTMVPWAGFISESGDHHGLCDCDACRLGRGLVKMIARAAAAFRGAVAVRMSFDMIKVDAGNGAGLLPGRYFRAAVRAIDTGFKPRGLAPVVGLHGPRPSGGRFTLFEVIRTFVEKHDGRMEGSITDRSDTWVSFLVPAEKRSIGGRPKLATVMKPKGQARRTSRAA